MSFFRRYAQNIGALIGLAILAVVVFVALAAPILYPGSPWQGVAEPLLVSVPFTAPGQSGAK